MLNYFKQNRGWLCIFGITLFASTILSVWMFRQSDHLREEASKIILQFLLVTVVGGLLVAFLAMRRDLILLRESRGKQMEHSRAADAVVLQEFIAELGNTVRSLKIVKRRMRSQLSQFERDNSGRPVLPVSIKDNVFEKCMDDLLTSQISAEDIRDRITIRTDLLGTQQSKRLKLVMRYAARYFHDVYQDYEHCKTARDSDYIIIDGSCGNISDFLVGREFPTDLPEATRNALEEKLKIFRDGEKTVDERYEAFRDIEAMRFKDIPKKRRYRAIAAGCFSLALVDLREQTEKRWRDNGLFI
jgi:hypothetical protein